VSALAGADRVDADDGVVLDREAEKRVVRMVAAAEQLIEKKTQLWRKRYERACSEAMSVVELDEAIRRLHHKFPHLGLDKILEDSMREDG
jgi:hypothetical protein